MYVAIRYSYLSNHDIVITNHSTDLLECRRVCNNIIDSTITHLNEETPDIIYSRKFSDNYKEVILYRIGYKVEAGYLYDSKTLINDDVYSYRIFHIPDKPYKRYYQTTFTYITVEVEEEPKKKSITRPKMPEDLLLSLKTKNKSDLL